MFTALFGHKSVLSSKKSNYGKLFTPTVTVSMTVLLVIVLGCVFAPVFATHDPNAQDVIGSSLALPSAQHWLGADNTGRDIYSRLLYGGRTILLGALGVVAFSALVGIPLGLVAGYYGRRIDGIIMRVCDVILSFPSLLLAFIFVAGTQSRGIGNAIIALGIVYVPMLTRLIRSLTLVEKNKIYVSACVSLGYSDLRIMYRHILPNCISTVLVQLTLDVAYAILDLAALSFLGLGIQPPQADWGNMLNDGRAFLLRNPYISLAPGGAIVLTVVSINILSDGLHQYLDHSQTELPTFQKYARRLRRETQREARRARKAQAKGGASA